MARALRHIGEMSFLDHLEELRWAILKSVLAVLSGMIVCFFFADEILKFVISPTRLESLNIKLIFLRPAGMFMVKVNLSLACGFATAMPVVLFQLWRFISPGLLPNEKKYIPYVIVFSTVLFLAGASFAFYVLIPAMVQFFVLVGIEGITAEWDIGEYMSLVLKMVITMGLVFEMPLLIAFLTWIRILSANFLKRNWRMAVVVSFIVSAVITPTIDPYTQVLVALPLVVLYFLSLAISILIERPRRDEPDEVIPDTAPAAPAAAADGPTYPRGMYNFTGPESGMKYWPADEYIFEYDREDPSHAANRSGVDNAANPSDAGEVPPTPDSQPDDGAASADASSDGHPSSDARPAESTQGQGDETPDPNKPSETV